MQRPQRLRLRGDRRGAIAVVFALAALAFLMIVGLAIDFAGSVAAKTNLEMAADAGVFAGVTSAVTLLATDPDFLAKGQAAGNQRFVAQAGQAALALGPTGSLELACSDSVCAANSKIDATLNWSATYQPFFAKLFGSPVWALSGVSRSSVQVPAPYLNVELMLDVSPSMAIGATSEDMAVLETQSPCDPSNALYYLGSNWTLNATTPVAWSIPDGWVEGYAGGYWSEFSLEDYANYTCQNYTGIPPCPVPTPAGLSYPTFPATGQNAGPSCQGALPMTNGQYPLAGPPCAFSCHWDGARPAGSGNDLWAMARKYGVTLRLDLLKNAINGVINQMALQSQKLLNAPDGNLGIGIFTFAAGLTQVYPTVASKSWKMEAGNVLDGTALETVGTPGTPASPQDTGVQPFLAMREYVYNNATYFIDSMNQLAQQLTKAGDGTTAIAPRKVLFLVTDGFEDDEYGRFAMPYSECQQFKDLGYTVYVLYTPYYPVLHTWYLNGGFDRSVVEGNGTNSITYNLQACASAPSDYIEASDSADISAALQTFLKQALLNYSARLTQ